MGNIVNVLIVDDSTLVRNILKDIFSNDPEVRVVGEAADGKEAIELTAQLKPDIITMDVQMPRMDGFEATEYIMAYHPTPILIFSSAIDKSEQYTSFKAIALGALDNMSKPDITQDGFESVANSLLRKVKMLARIKVIPHIRGKLKVRENGFTLPTPVVGASAPATVVPTVPPGAPNRYKLLAVGASTGGPMALKKILSGLPASFPIGIALVQHITPGFIDSFVDWLGTATPLKVKVARTGEAIKGGTVYLAPDSVQMEISEENTIILNKDAPFWGEFKPSVNSLFDSVGKNLREKAIGIILTGMGSDGALGMKRMFDNGGFTIAQDEASSLIFGMPKAAIDAQAVHSVLPLDDINRAIFRLIQE